MLSPGSGAVGGSVARPTKDPNWLTLEVCREYARNKCNRVESECKFAHPPPHIDVQNGRVTCCFDSLQVWKMNSLVYEFWCSHIYLSSVVQKNSHRHAGTRCCIWFDESLNTKSIKIVLSVIEVVIL